MSQELKSKYTRSDLDGLAEEEKQAWLEVVEDGKEAEAEEATAAAAGAAAARIGADVAAAMGGVEEAAREAKAEEEAGGAGATLSPAIPEGKTGCGTENESGQRVSSCGRVGQG